MATAERETDASELAGRAALAQGAWAEARKHFQDAVQEVPTATAWEGLGWAGWWLADEALTFEAREQAYRAHRAAGDRVAAARVAAWIALDHREYRGDAAIGRGWLGRAQRLLDGLPECSEHGWVALFEGDFALNIDGDPVETARQSAYAARLGRELGVPDLEAVGLAQEGIALVLQGRVEEGMRGLDEASALALSEEMHYPMSVAWSFCCLVSACDGVGDFPRAAQWCDAMRGFHTRWGGRQILGICRSAYGRVLATSGDWVAADVELTAAVEDLETARPGMASSGLMRLGELRARQGRTADARALYERAGPRGLVGLGELALDEGDAGAAADSAERVLRATSSDSMLERLPALELLVRSRSQLGEFDAARDANGEIEAAAAQLGTPYLTGRARLVAGELAAAGGDHDHARRCFEDAVDCLEEGSAPYDAAVARLALARSLAALGHEDRAAAEALVAREAFESLGAARDLERAAMPLMDAVTPAGAGSVGDLTARELEVLRLVAQGHSDAEIAQQLVLSPHTVHRHVANVRSKLRLPSRAAAVGYAARADLL